MSEIKVKKMTAQDLARRLKGFYKNPISVELTSYTESPDVYLTVTYLAKKNWRNFR